MSINNSLRHNHKQY